MIKVIAVDDVAENLVALEALLRRPGLQILTARSGTDALELLLVHEVALALIDVQMPGMCGFELAELMRGAPRTSAVPIIFVTAAPHDRTRLFRGYEAGAVDFLHKPIEPHVLRSKVDVFVDLHRHKQRLDEQVGLLQQALQLNETLAAVLGHDLRSPLSAITTAASMILRGPPEPAAQRAAERILRCSARMARLIEHLLCYSRTRLGQELPIEPRPVDLMSLCAAVLDEQEPGAAGRFHLRGEGDPGGHWDPDRLAQVLSNLIGNALRHGASGTPIEVRVDGSRREEVRLRVRNQGAIPPEILPSIFEPFRTTAGGRAATDGLGLGLYIVQRLVEAHGGKVVAASSPAEGTSFEVTLPRRAPAAGA
ncbi:hybrid sensor histidine kinase/response regulator [Sorangium sp. So ce1036]|uniref:hybrid sensor histidine kinase/response regulator n=1 Tax=Sorangium sp. So ce1036 TaxID=3133328 RepID=UPI003F0BC9DC